MKYKSIYCSFFCGLLLFTTASFSQYKITGLVKSDTDKTLNKVQIYSSSGKLLTKTDTKGSYFFLSDKKNIHLFFYADGYKIQQREVSLKKGINRLDVLLSSFLSEELSEVHIKQKKLEFSRLKDVEQTAIYAGKKSQIINLSESTANLASNNTRQIYSQIVGLNIFENDDAGLQLHIGGRGLDPNRTSNFNTRQNGYDISADVLGYPESYYTPPAEAIEEIQIVRGAASLQYGTQFGGLINFVLKKPNPNKNIEILNRNTLGSYNLYTNFASISGTNKKTSYYSFYNYKQGKGFRPNSEFKSKNAFFHIGYSFNTNTKLEAELSYLYYLAQQAGGLTDAMFNENPFQSNRSRNWFEVNWLLYNLKLSHSFSQNTRFTFNFFGLDAKRNALGFRPTDNISQTDLGGVRDLVSGSFKNFGFETRFLTNYKLFNKKAVFLIGNKFYKAKNTSVQGPGSDSNNANFNLALNLFPNYPFQSNYNNPNLNIAAFSENIFYINNKFSITPGFRFEYIKTESRGYTKIINLNGAGEVIFNKILNSSNIKNRSFVLLGLGLSYKANNDMEIYGNLSQNYRSVTFSDINLVNQLFKIDPQLDDEKGFTADLGVRGSFKNIFSYDFGVFGLFYNDRIGLVFKEIKAEKTNTGDARILGIENLLNFNIKSILGLSSNYGVNYFINTSFLNSKYTSSEIPGAVNNAVEFTPIFNLKTGLKFVYNNLSSSIQYSYVSSQFTDISNSTKPSKNGIIGIIPSYDILDFSASYKYKIFKLEAGVNNVLNNKYFTRRATGYPGPGIIPSAPVTFYTTLEIKI
ncbi:MAG: TonB-dependent receptor family protein [Tenacibaculum sp.]